MGKIFIALVLIMGIAGFTTVTAQNLTCAGNYGQIQIIGDDVNMCGDGVHLQLQFMPGTDPLPPSTDSYIVVQNPYNPEPWSSPNTFSITIDDVWMPAPFDLPVCFSFFGKKYKKCVMGPNGQISFDTTRANQWGTWVIGAALPTFNVDLNNTIMGPFHDLLPPNANGSVNWAVYGTSPCRRFVISWDSVPYFSCTSIYARQQIVIYETTNEITVNIEAVPICSGWNGGKAIEGIQNNNATKYYTVPGRNATSWSAYNDSWSFVPAGTQNTIDTSLFYWYDSATNTLLDTGLFFDYWPAQDMAVYVRYEDSSNCIEFTSPYRHLSVVQLDANFSYVITPTCGSNSVQFTYTGSIAPGAANFSWDFGDGTPPSTQMSPVHNYTTNGPFNVTLTVTDPTCTGSQTQVVNPLIVPLVASFTASNDTICVTGSNFTFTNTSLGGYVDAQWDFGDGMIINNMSPVVNYTYSAVGTYTVVLTLIDGGGCTDSASFVVSYMPVQASFTGIKNFGCNNDSLILFNNSINGANYLWSFGDGNTSTAISPLHVYQSQNVYNVTLVASNGFCADTASNVYNFVHPFVNNFQLSDDSVCIGTPFTSFNNSVGGGLTYLWNMGDGTVYTTKDITHVYQQGGAYTVSLTIQDTVGCILTTTTNIYVDGPVYTHFTPSFNTGCVYDNVFYTDSVSSFATRFVYRFGNGDTLENTHNPSWGYSQAGTYIVELQSDYRVCPSDIYSETIVIYPYPIVDLGPDTSICPGVQTIVLSDNNNPGATHMWNDQSTASSLSTSSPGTYYCEVAYGPCKTTDTVNVLGSLDCLFIPNAFTPNKDNKNDYFKPYFYSEKDVTHYAMHLFERWGKEVFTSYSIQDKGWDGTFRGQEMAGGVYMYILDIELVDGTKKTYKGDVTLIR